MLDSDMCPNRRHRCQTWPLNQLPVRYSEMLPDQVGIGQDVPVIILPARWPPALQASKEVLHGSYLRLCGDDA